MGVKYLWKIIQKAARNETPKNQRLAIDTSIWLHFHKNIPHNLYIYLTCKRILKLLYHKNRPVFVFDTGIPREKIRVAEERSKIKVEDLARKYIRNQTCKICELPYKECKHATVEKQEYLDMVDTKVKDSVERDRPQNWGRYFDDEIKILDEDDFKSMSDVKKLNVLVNLREKRKLPVRYETGDGLDFSIGQINNLKKRNKINSMIQRLENKDGRRIMSDCDRILVMENEVVEKRDEFEDEIMDVFVNTNEEKYNFEDSNINGMEIEDGKSNNDKMHVRSHESLNSINRIELPKINDFSYSYLEESEFFQKNEKDNEKDMDLDDELFQIFEEKDNEVYNFNDVCLEYESDSYEDNRNEKYENNEESIKVYENKKEEDRNDKNEFNMNTILKDRNGISKNIMVEKFSIETKNNKIEQESTKNLQDNVNNKFDIIQNTINIVKSNDLEINIKEKECDEFENYEKELEEIASQGKVIDLNVYNKIECIENENTGDSDQGNENRKLSSDHEDGFSVYERNIINQDYNTEIKILTNHIKDIIRVFDLPYIDAPLEADSQCAFLSMNGIVDGVITEDNDVFLYGCKTVYRNYYKRNQNVHKYTLEDIEQIINRNDMVKISYLLGSDYGQKKALEAVRNGEVEEKCCTNLMNLYYKPLVKNVQNIQWQRFDSSKIYKYLRNNNIAGKQFEELVFFINKINGRQTFQMVFL